MKATAPALVCIALFLALTGCAEGDSLSVKAEPPRPPAVADRLSGERVEVQPLGVAVFGDSITAWDPPYAGDPAQSWVNTARVDVPFTCGWAVPGATLGEMAAGAVPCSAFFLVVMGGTNDLYLGVPVEDRLAAIDSIVATVAAREVVISAVAPYGFDWAAGVQWNAELAAYASAHHFRFIDPWGAVRTADGAWLPGADRGDRVHPSPATAAVVGGTIRDALVYWYSS